MRSSLVLLIAPLALAAAPGARSDLPRLVATVGPGFTIDLADARGAHVDVVTAGKSGLFLAENLTRRPAGSPK